jgi:hypothetical protein
MGADEEGVLARLKAARKSLVDPTEFLLVVLERGVYQRPLTVSVSGLADQAFSDTPWGRAEGQP